MNERIFRENTRPVQVGNLTIGGSEELTIQSMTTTKTHDVEATVAEIHRLEEVGCQIVRVACPDERAANALSAIKKRIHIPLVADIHFDYRLALKAIDAGVDKIRINPGNIGRRDRVEKVVNAAKAKNIPIRIGVNAGSLEKKIIQKYGYPTAEGMVESALAHIKILEDLDFYDIIVSLKASDVNLAIEAYDKASRAFNYPLHLGITESGTQFAGGIKSAAGLGAILSLGIGNTLRVSLSADPVEEIKVAVLGCAVNGPGEAREADIGIAGSNGEGLLFRHGKIIRKVPEAIMVEELKKEIDILAEEYFEKKTDLESLR
ncbi:flavodoxin-dependent (E)-4-hydroxy-3-methylbut-2-enyl-diphosphate synthase [Listeria monocytogenes]|nr:flavodoxin-dependent (E)-4-hydroxy-3-methylbut-2-enyl-diphosphate synthase [Listeria monocytogenes]